jgi:ParB-like chromosome segregation protein Spo0J
LKGVIRETGELVEIGPAHPVADLFPMMAEEQLAQLADSIRAQGLIHAVELDPDHQVLDGRNRLESCRRADVTPEVTIYEGPNPGLRALASNTARRDTTKGQEAMAAVAATFNLNMEQGDLARAVGVKQSDISKARAIQAFAPTFVDRVLAGTVAFDVAYQMAQEARQERQERERHERELQNQAPDLWELVPENLPFEEAWAAYEKRTEEDRRQEQIEEDRCRRFTRGIADALVELPALLDPKPEEMLQTSWRPGANPHRNTPGIGRHFRPAGVRETAELLVRVADYLEQEEVDLL